MFFWKINKLKEILLIRSLTNKELIQYYIASGILLSFVTAILEISPASNAFQVGFNLIISIAIILIGSNYLYRKNGGASGRQLLDRLLSIGWVVTIRLLAFGMPIILILTLVAAIFGGVFYGLAGKEPDEEGMESALNVLLSIMVHVWAGLVFWRTGKHISDLAKENH